MQTQVLLIRHGQTAWNVEERPRGRADVPLDEAGRQQAEATARYIAARWTLSRVYTSPLSRAMDTAAPIAAAQGLEAQPLAGLLDIDYGKWTGVDRSDLQNRYPDLYRIWDETPHLIRFPNGERLSDVRRRSTAALQEVVTRHPGQTVAMIAHTTVNRVLLCAILDLGDEYHWHLAQDTCAVNLIEWNGKHYRLALMNDTSHLAGARL